MHFFTVFIVLAVAFRWGDWRNWQKYHSTMLFIALGNLTYNFLCANYFLWRFIPEHFSNHSVVELIYTFIVFPATALLFLSNYPEESLEKLVYYFKWVFVYGVFEYIFILNKGITYEYGWNFWFSIAFDIVMFPLLRLHQTRPLWAYLFAILMGSFITFYFDVPVEIPIEDRK